jgi:hypothetical protein
VVDPVVADKGEYKTLSSSSNKLKAPSLFFFPQQPIYKELFPFYRCPGLEKQLVQIHEVQINDKILLIGLMVE